MAGWRRGFWKIDVTQDHIGRLVSNNVGGKYDAMLTATDNVYQALGGSISSETIASAIQVSRTAAKAAHRNTIADSLSGLSGTLHGQFRKGSVQYLEFFPQGLDEIHQAREPQVKGILDRVVAAAGTHLPASVAALTALKTQWESLYTSASLGRAATTNAEQAQAEAKQALQIQLTKNLLALALEYVGQPDKANDFFDESRLYNPQRAAEPTPAALQPV